MSIIQISNEIRTLAFEICDAKEKDDIRQSIENLQEKLAELEQELDCTDEF